MSHGNNGLKDRDNLYHEPGETLDQEFVSAVENLVTAFERMGSCVTRDGHEA